MFIRPGSVSSFSWAQIKIPKLALDRSYIASEEMLRVPIRTVVLYYLVWILIIVIKSLFGYYLLLLPVVSPVNFILEVDFSCWRPWGKDIETNSFCASVSA